LGDRRGAGKRRNCDWKQPDASHVVLLVASTAKSLPLQSLRGSARGFRERGTEQGIIPLRKAI
jgi:hypothetical protein